MTRYSFLILLLARLANAQSSGSAGISGTVVNGKTGEPIKGAQVTIGQSIRLLRRLDGRLKRVS